MAAGLTVELMDMSHIVKLIDDAEAAPKKRGPTRKRPPRMPTNVRRFAWLWIISWLIGVLEIFFMPPPTPDFIKEGITRQTEMVLTGGLLVVLLVLLLPFFWLAVWKQKNWCRWFLLVLFIAPVPFLFLDPSSFRPDLLPLTISGIGGTALEAVGFFFVFTGDAKAWFRPNNSN